MVLMKFFKNASEKLAFIFIFSCVFGKVDIFLPSDKNGMIESPVNLTRSKGK